MLCPLSYAPSRRGIAGERLTLLTPDPRCDRDGSQRGAMYKCSESIRPATDETSPPSIPSDYRI
ncbi:hypothetical protein EXE53_24365 [Halorubrum sp. SD626R]|nr:hypothetical protein EXE53_24365 [Halorubrum sp. SD626R]